MVLRLLLLGDLPDGAGGADLRAAGALRAAVATLVGHLGLHEMLEVCRWPQHIVRALGHAQLAGGASTVEILDALRSGRRQGNVALRYLLVQDGGEPAIDLLLLRLQRRRPHGQRRSGNKCPAAGIRGGGRRPLLHLLPPGEAILQRPELAVLDAVEAIHAAGVVDLVFGDVDARRLAVVLADLAVLAFLRVDDRAEHCESGEEAERRAHRADRIAIGTSVLPSQDDDRNQRDDGHDERRQAPQPDLLFIESIAISPLRQRGEQVVDPDVNRLEQVPDDASPGAIRRQEGHERMNPGHERDNEQHPHTIPQPFHLRAVAVRLAVLLPAFARHIQVCHSVLEHAQRADDGAIDPAKQESQENQADNGGHIEGQEGRQELQLCHPAEPSVQRPGEIQEQQRNAQPKQDGQCNADLFEHGVPSIGCMDKDSKKYLIQDDQCAGRM